MSSLEFDKGKVVKGCLFVEAIADLRLRPDIMRNTVKAPAETFRRKGKNV